MNSATIKNNKDSPNTAEKAQNIKTDKIIINKPENINNNPDTKDIPIVEEQKSIINKTNNSTNDKIVSDTIKEPILEKKETNKSFISIEDIKKESIQNEKKKKEEERNKNIEKEKLIDKEKQIKNQNKGDSKELFTNYKADYIKKKETLTQQIKKLKNLPKTHYKSLIWLIVLTTLWIWLLFYISPNNHSIQNYKASILNIVYKDQIEEKRLEIEKEYLQLQEELRWRIEYIKYLWFNFTVEARTLNWIKNYKYNNTIYDSKKLLDEVLIIEVEKIKKWIIKNVLINSFK